MTVLDQGQRFFFECNGYLVLPDVLDARQLDALRAVCDEAEQCWRADASLAGVRRHDLDQVMAIVEYDELFFTMLTYPPVFGAVRELLGPDISLLDHDYFITPPGATIHKGWHYDESFPNVYHPRSRLMIKVFYVLHDIPADGGGTVMLPGSHSFAPGWTLPNPPVPEDMPASVRMNLRAGCAYFMAGRLFHSVGNNLSARQRKLLIYTYGHKWMRTWDGYEPSERVQSWARTPMERQLLGLTDPYGRNAGWEEKEREESLEAIAEALE
ncbi:MAG: hypothetical protein GKR94_00420 [Gammaproteobacteria bacterium]|nr:hypothetical protein [Gammaproteobacteria bacterium]